MEVGLFLVSLCLVVLVVVDGQKSVRRTAYTHQEEMKEELEALAEKNPEVASTYVLGTSVQGREILGLRLAVGGGERPLLRPMVKYVANIHGDEAVTREILLGLAQHLVWNYGTNRRVTRLLNETEVHLVPAINPDGFETMSPSGRSWLPLHENANKVNIDTDFPTWRDYGKSRQQLLEKREPETAALMEMILDHPWALSASLHTGALLVSYPWAASYSRPWSTNPLFQEHRKGEMLQYSPDHPEFVSLANLYATKHGYMADTMARCHWEAPMSDYENNYDSGVVGEAGVTNSADWWPEEGTMQDFNYIFSNCLELSMELACDWIPAEEMIQSHWVANKEPMLAFLEEADKMIRGIVTDGAGQPVGGARVRVEERGKDLVTSPRGEFWRLLTPGEYTIWAFTEEMSSGKVQIEVKESGPGPRIDLHLTEPYTPEERPDYPPPKKLPEGMDICVVNTPILQSVSTSIAAIPYLPEALWLHEVIGPVIFDLSLTDTNLKFERTNYGTIQMMVQHWLKQLQASEENLLSETEPWKTFLEFTNVGEDLESMVTKTLDAASELLDQVEMVVEEVTNLPPGVIESYANSALSMLQDLAADEEVWNSTMGTNVFYGWVPHDEESGLLCAYTYFHSLYVIEWYYDYIGYDYYHEDFNFYYYDYDLYSGSGSGSGDYYYDYSGSGAAGDYYHGSGSGSGMSDDGFGLYDYDSYDDYYFYYDDKYADFHNVYLYFFSISTPLRDLILSNDAEEVFTSLASSLMRLVRAMPTKTTLKLMRTAMKDLKKSLEAGASQPLVHLLSQAREVMAGTEEGAKMKELVANKLLGTNIWRKAQEKLHGLEETFYAELLTLARGQELISSDCEIDLGRGAIPIVCATSEYLWHFLDWVHMLDYDYEVGIFMGQRSMRRTQKEMKKLNKFLKKEGDGFLCKLVGVTSEVSGWAMNLFFGGEQEEALLIMMEQGTDLSTQLLSSC